jgi:site-specific DNA recombinase
MNRAMLGETKAGTVGWKPIIDQDTFDRLQALLTDPSRKVTHSPGVKGGKYSMGGGLTVCAKCGESLITSTKSGGGQGKYPALGCLRRVHGPSARHPQVEREVTRGRAEKDPAVDEKIAAHNDRRTALVEKLDRTEDLAIEGLISKVKLKAARESINAEVEQIGKDIGKLVGKPSVGEVFGKLDRILAAWPRWTPGQRREFLKMLIKRVVVDDWPEGVPRSTPPKKDETSEQHLARHRQRAMGAVAARTRIEWREDV